MNCQTCQHEYADDMSVCPNCGAKNKPEAVEEAVSASETRTVAINTNGKNKLPFILTFASLLVVAIGYIMFWVANIALNGKGVANSKLITSIFGRIMTSVVHTLILVPCVIAIIYVIRMVMKKEHVANSLSKISLFPKVLSLFAIFSCIDAFCMFFYALLGNAIVGVTYDSNYEIIGAITNFWGYRGLGITKAVANMEDSALAIVVTIGFALFTFLFVAFSFFIYNRITAYYNTLTNTATGAQYDKDTKPPVILSFVFAGLNVALAVASLMAGVWVDAVIQIGTALFLGAGAWMFMVIHKQLHSTSVE